MDNNSYSSYQMELHISYRIHSQISQESILRANEERFG